MMKIDVQQVVKERNAQLMREIEQYRFVLARCRTILMNMARENEGAIFKRWPIHHEPLRNDARNVLPAIDAVLGGKHEND